MLNLFGINSNTPVKFILGALLLALGVMRHSVILIAAGALLLSMALIMRSGAKH